MPAPDRRFVIPGCNPRHNLETPPVRFMPRLFRDNRMEHKRRYPADRHDLVLENEFKIIRQVTAKGIVKPGCRHMWQSIKTGIVGLRGLKCRSHGHRQPIR